MEEIGSEQQNARTPCGLGKANEETKVPEGNTYFWNPCDWPEQVRREIDEWRLYATTGRLHDCELKLPHAKPLRPTTMQNYERAFAMFFGGLRELNLVSNDIFTPECFYALINDENAISQWASFVLDRTRRIRGEPDYTPETIPWVLSHLAAFVRKWYFPVKRPELLSVWSYVVPDHEVKAALLLKKWRNSVQVPRPHDQRASSSDEIMFLAMKINATAKELSNSLERSIAYRTSAILTVLASCPIRVRHIADARFSREDEGANIFVDESGRWHIRFPAEKSQNGAIDQVLPENVDEYLTAWVSDPNQRENLLPLDNSTGKRVDNGLMFPSARNGRKLDAATISMSLRQCLSGRIRLFR